MSDHISERDPILTDYDLETARIDVEIADLQRRRAANLYERQLYLCTGMRPDHAWSPVRSPRPS